MLPDGAGDDLTLDLLPAGHGDALLLTWGPPTERRRMLIDGGPAYAYQDVTRRLESLLAGDPLDLVVLTHVDADHIEGTILLVNDAKLGIHIEELWFNGTGQLDDLMGPIHGEILGSLLELRDIPWNTAAQARAIAAAENGEQPCYPRSGGLRLTVVGPDRATLRRLRDEWLKVCDEHDLTFGSTEDGLRELRKRAKLIPDEPYLGQAPTPLMDRLLKQIVEPDDKIANASSIVLLAEYGEVSILLAGDATPAVLLSAVRALLAARGIDRLPLTAFKLPHHGSARNLTRELVELLPADAYLFSSNGKYYHHPDPECVARILEYGTPGATLVFNYCSERTTIWDAQDELADEGYRYNLRYPVNRDDGVRISWSTAGRLRP